MTEQQVDQLLRDTMPRMTVEEIEFLTADNGDETDFDDSDNDDICHTCRGSGIGKNGDPDKSRCTSCGGSGVVDISSHVRPNGLRSILFWRCIREIDPKNRRNLANSAEDHND